MIYSAIRFLHEDGKHGEWLPASAADRAAVEYAMQKLCADRAVLGFERRDIDQAEYERMARAVKFAVRFRDAPGEKGGQA